MAAMFLIASLATPSNANAQNSSGNVVSLDSWETIKLSYSPTTFESITDDMDFKGFSFEYIKGQNVVDNKPIFLEWGIGAEILNYTDEDSEYYEGYRINVEEAINIADIYIPVNIGYKLAINNNTTIMPYVGIKAQLNIFAEERMEVSAGTYSEEETLNLFDREDMGDNYVKRVWVGWHIGATIEMNKWSVGIRYGKSFNDKVINDIYSKVAATTISVGYFF